MHILFIGLVFILVMAFAVSLQTASIYCIWNYLVPVLFTVQNISFTQSFAAAILFTIIMNVLRVGLKHEIVVKR